MIVYEMIVYEYEYQILVVIFWKILFGIIIHQLNQHGWKMEMEMDLDMQTTDVSVTPLLNKVSKTHQNFQLIHISPLQPNNGLYGGIVDQHMIVSKFGVFQVNYNNRLIKMFNKVLDQHKNNPLLIHNGLKCSLKIGDYLCTSHFSKEGLRILFEDNAGGQSEISEAISFEILHYIFNATLSKTEMQIVYTKENCKKV